MKEATLSDMLKQAYVKTKNQLIEFYDSSWQDCPDTG